MTRDYRTLPFGPSYAPLLGRMVECATLHVSRFSGRKLKPARDEGGRVIELPVGAELPDLQRRVAAPGRYRVSARDPTTGDHMAHSDYAFAPDAPKPSPIERAPEPPVMAPYFMPSIESDRGYIAMMHETANSLRDQLRETRMQADREIDGQRERADAKLRASEEERKALAARAHDAEVRLARLGVWLEEREARVARLEREVAELKAEVAQARRQAAEQKRKAQEVAFSPLDALAHVDQALDVIGKAAERFGKKA